MIYLYTGTPGSGKSYHQIEKIFDYLMKGKSVISNFPLKFGKRHIKKGVPDRHYFIKNDDIKVDTLVKLSRMNKWYEKESNCLICLDEAGMLFNSRDFGKKDRMAWIEFFSQHRKFGFDVILVCQLDRMLDRQIRSLAEYEVKHRKINNFGILKWLPITTFMYVTYWYGIRQRVSSETSIFLKSIAGRYDTMALFNSLSDDGKAASGPALGEMGAGGPHGTQPGPPAALPALDN